MDEASFWSALEFRVCRELSGVEACRRIGLWCDGFIPQDHVLDAMPRTINGKAWIGQGKRQEQWEFTLILPSTTRSLDEIRWLDLLPADNVTDWLTLDHDRKALVIAPEAAVNDAP